MTKLQDDERSSKTMADNLRWLKENVGKVVPARSSGRSLNASDHSPSSEDQR